MDKRLVCVLAVLAGCAPPAHPKLHRIRVNVVSDPGLPLPDAALLRSLSQRHPSLQSLPKPIRSQQRQR